MSKALSRTLVLLLVFGLALAACREVQEEEELPPPQATEAAVEEAVSQFALTGSAWQLEYFGQPEDNLAVLEGTRPTVNYFVDRYTGSGGCNWFLGVYATDGDNLRMETPAETHLLCEPVEEVMGQEATYKSSLLNVARYEVDGEKLLGYTGSDQLLLTFVPAEEVPIEGTVWKLQFYFTGDRMTEAVLGTEITAQFEGDQISGSSGCNSYNATAEVDGNRMTIGPVASTQQNCSEPELIMDQEALYLSILESVAGYVKSGGMLQMLNEEGFAVLYYAAQAE